MKIKKLFITVGVALMVAGAALADNLAVTNTAATAIGKNGLTLNGLVTGITTAASSSNNVLTGFVWGTADGTNVMGSWSYTNSYASLAGVTNGGTFAVTLNGLPNATTIYWRAFGYQQDAGSNIVALSGVTASTNTASLNYGTLPTPITLSTVKVGGTSYTASALASGALIRSNLIQTITITNGVGGTWTFSVVTNVVAPASGATLLKLQ